MKTSVLRKQHFIQLILALIILILIGYISSKVFFRIDLTSEHRFTLSSQTKTTLRQLHDVVVVKVYLDGEMPTGFKKLKNAIKEDLNEFRVYGKENIQYQFINPAQSEDRNTRKQVFTELEHKGLHPASIQSSDKEGAESEKILLPGAIVSYNGIEIPVNFLKNNVALSAEENLNNSIENIEYELIHAIHNLTSKKTDKIAFLEGQGELDEYSVGDISRELSNYFEVDRGAINGKPGVLDSFKAVIIANPSKAFKEADKFVLDQYIMNGGKVLWIVNQVNVNTDSLAYGSTFGVINDLNINDQLFTYGVRLNSNLVQDVICNTIPVNSALSGDPARFTKSPWLYYPLIYPSSDNLITRSLNMIWLRYPSQIDTLKGNGKIHHTVLLKTSPYARIKNAPLYIGLDEINHTPERKDFNRSGIPLADLMEGQFPSDFKDRPVGSIIPGYHLPVKEISIPTRMMVISDGNIIANDVQMTAEGPFQFPLGYDKYNKQTFGNKDFLVNAVNYLTDEGGIMSLRAKIFKLRILDKAKIRDEKLKWQLINTLVPNILVIAFGIVYFYYRKKKYAWVK